MPQYDSKHEQVVQAIMPPYRQDEAKGLSQPVVEKFENALRTALADDPWLCENSALLTQRTGLAWFGSKLYIPQPLRSQVLYRCHDSKTAGHFGYLKTLH
ncbi:hypothetical protein NXF25_019124 [Crotalus adamanteus]|uniref:Integrase zinc-binding domain-containing protein n=1 Tax=Crotalus adamanteus TaxID=8729 RepID=A0AAW1B1R1_CROAD